MNDLVYSGNEFIEAIVSICEEKLINFMNVCNCSFNFFFVFGVFGDIRNGLYEIFSCDAEVSVDTTRGYLHNRPCITTDETEPCFTKIWLDSFQ